MSTLTLNAASLAAGAARGRDAGPGRHAVLARRTVPGRHAVLARVRWARLAVVTVLVAVVAVGLAVAAAAVAGGLAGRAPAGDGAVVRPPTALVRHTVVPGDTLWDLAVEVDPHGDPRDMVERIMRLNDLRSARVALGEEILLPAAP